MLGLLRPRSGPELIDAAVAIARRHYGPVLRVAAPIFLPYLVLELTVFAHRPELFWLDLTTWYASAALAGGAVAHAVADAYHGREVEPRRSVVAAVRRAPALLAAAALRWAFLIVGFAFFLAPAFYLGASFFAVAPVVVLEGRSPVAALQRSYDLSTDGRWRILAVLTVTVIVVLVVDMSVGMGLNWLLGGDGSLLVRVAGTVVGAVVAPVSEAVPVLLYYDQRIRREGYDLEVLLPADAPALGISAPAV